MWVAVGHSQVISQRRHRHGRLWRKELPVATAAASCCWRCRVSAPPTQAAVVAEWRGWWGQWVTPQQVPVSVMAPPNMKLQIWESKTTFTYFPRLFWITFLPAIGEWRWPGLKTKFQEWCCFVVMVCWQRENRWIMFDLPWLKIDASHRMVSVWLYRFVLV